MKYNLTDLRSKLHSVRKALAEGISLVSKEVDNGRVRPFENIEDNDTFDPAKYTAEKLINIQQALNILEIELAPDAGYTLGFTEETKKKLFEIREKVIDIPCESV